MLHVRNLLIKHYYMHIRTHIYAPTIRHPLKALKYALPLIHTQLHAHPYPNALNTHF